MTNKPMSLPYFLCLCESYPNRTSSALAYAHTRNLIYKEHGANIKVLNFSTIEDYEIDGIQVMGTSSATKTIKDDPPGLIISHAPNLKNHLGFLVRHFNLSKSIPWVFFIHGHEVLHINKYYPPPSRNSLGYYLKYTLRSVYDPVKLFILKHFWIYSNRMNTMGFVFVSQWMKKHFELNLNLSPEKYSFNWKIIPNAVSKVFIDRQYDWHKTKVADFVTIRGSDEPKYALDIVYTLAKETPDKTFHVYYKGTYFNNLPSLKNLTVFAKHLNQQDVAKVLSDFRFALMPTRLDSQGVMACEMATFGIPIVTSDLDVCQEALAGFKNKFFIKNESPDLKHIPPWEKLAHPSDTNLTYHPELTTQKELDFFAEVIEKHNTKDE